MKKKATKTLLLSLSLVMVLSTMSLLSARPAASADLSQFNPERIIDDVNYTNSSSMSAADIQSFLNAKNSVCLKDFRSLSLNDKNGDGIIQDSTTEPYGDGVGNTMSAAELIKAAANIYRINPQVLLVTLQKEQGLITRTDCPSWRYNTALGYGCPDTAPCDEAAFGFTRQIDYGSYHLRGYFDDTLSYVPYSTGSHTVYYHPGPCKTWSGDSCIESHDITYCGATSLNIFNRATSSLYSYTPYQPNAASLAAEYGTGDTCSSYGNRNFYNYFTDWFGSTNSSPFFSHSGKVFIMGANNTYYHVPSQALLDAYGLASKFNNRISYVDTSFTTSMTYAGPLSWIARFESSEIFAVTQTGLHHFQTSEDYTTHYGYTFGQESVLPAHLRYTLPVTSPMTDIAIQSDGTKIYHVGSGKKHHISSPKAYTTTGSPVYSSRPYVVLPSDYIASIPEGAPVLAEGMLVKASDTGQASLYTGDTLRAIDSTTFNNWSVPVDYTSHSSLLTQIPASSLGAIADQLVTANQEYYLLDSGRKILFTADQLTAYGLSTTSFQSIDSNIFSRFTAKNMTALVRNSSSPEVHFAKEGKLYHMYSEEDLKRLGYWHSDVTVLRSSLAPLFTHSGLKYFTSGRLVRAENTPEVYLVDGSLNRRHIPSEEIFRQYGYSFATVSVVKSADLTGYAISAPVSRLLDDSQGSKWLADSGCKWQIASAVMSSYAYTDANFMSLSSATASSIRQCSTALTDLIRPNNSPRVYKVEAGKKRWITSEAAFKAGGYQWSQVRVISPEFASALPEGQNIQ